MVLLRVQFVLFSFRSRVHSSFENLMSLHYKILKQGSGENALKSEQTLIDRIVYVEAQFSSFRPN